MALFSATAVESEAYQASLNSLWHVPTPLRARPPRRQAPRQGGGDRHVLRIREVAANGRRCLYGPAFRASGERL